VTHSNNIGQIAYLQSEKHDLKRIYFGGSFIRGHQQTIHTLSYAINFWSKGRPASWKRRRGSTGNEALEEVGEVAESIGG
jgi:type II pantothenate kinase